MLPQFANRHGSAPHIEHFRDGSPVIARVRPSTDIDIDTSRRLTDLRRLARRYNAMLDQHRSHLRIAH